MGNKLSRTLPGDPNIQQLSRFTQAARYIHVALLAAYSYDWLATLPDEIELICESFLILYPDYRANSFREEPRESGHECLQIHYFGLSLRRTVSQHIIRALASLQLE